ncbi:MAG: O-antigen ligase family protein [Bryobacteraceae bacterium]
MLDRIAWILLCVFLFSVPWEKSVPVAGLGTLTRVLGALALAAGLTAAAWNRTVRRANLVLALAAVFVAWSAATWFWSVDRAATLARAWTFLQLLAMAALIWNLCRTQARQRQLLEAYLGGAAVSAVATIIRYSLNQQTYWRRYAAPGFEPNDLGLTLALAIPMALYLALHSPGWRVWMYRAAVVVVIAGVLLTASRTALIATFAGFLFVAFTWRQTNLGQKISAAVLAGLLALSLVRLAPSPSRQRLATLPAELTHGTLNKRTSIWKAGLKVFKRHPVLGIGSGAYPKAVEPYLAKVPGQINVAHNTFLSVLVECGVTGFAFFGILLLAAAVFVWAMAGADRALWLTMLVAWGAGVQTLTWETRKPTWVIFALIMTSWALAFRREKPR